MKKNISFYSEGVKLDGDIYYPDDLKDGEAPGSCSATDTLV